MEDKTATCEYCGKTDVKNMGSHLRFCEKAKEAGQQEQAEKSAGEPKPRRKRVPLGIRTRKLSFDNMDPNYQYRVVNDRGNRLSRAQMGGYEFVGKQEGELAGEDVSTEMQRGTDSRVSTVVGTDEGGQPIRGYLMKIRKEFYDEDQQAKQQALDDTEEAVFGGRDKQGRPGVEGRYLPEDVPGQPIMETSIRSFRG